MPRPGPRTTYRYSDRFKATAVRLSELPGVAVQDVAESLYIHPFMLSRWRKQAREAKIEHEILKKPSSSLPNERRGLRVHRVATGAIPGERALPAAEGE